MRPLLGYDRLDDPGLLAPISALDRGGWEPRHNFFLPSAKLEAKRREGAKVKRKHDQPRTPCERRRASPEVSAAAKRGLKAQRAALHPFARHRRLEAGLRAILHRALHSSRPTDSLPAPRDADKITPTWVS